MRRQAIVLATLVLIGLLAWGFARSSLSKGAVGSGPAIRHVSWATAARPHPHGPEADEVTRRAGRSWSAAVMWTGAGRHPVWRGCQHRYDPALTSFIFGNAPSSG
jgi:hypothetical protein